MVIKAMDCSTSAGFSDDSESEPDNAGGENVDNDNNSDDSSSVQSDTPNVNNEEISDDDNGKQQLFLCLYIVASFHAL